MGITILVVLLVVFIFLAALALVRTSMFLRTQEPVEPVELPEVNAELIGGNLAIAVRSETVSAGPDSPLNMDAFRELRRALETLYPSVHSTLQREIISDFSLLYTWKGSNPELLPILFCSHQDVVPADPDTLDQWEHPPFSGELVDGFVWGRGSLDNKSQMIGLLEAVEYLIKNSFTPTRTLYLAFGQDEEIGGRGGAEKIAAYFEQRGERMELVLDEGGPISQGMLTGVEEPVALVGIAEKGHLTLRLKVTGLPGHSSAPPSNSAISILARAITSIEDSPLPAHLFSLQQTYRTVGAAASPWLQMMFANQWLFGRAIRRQSESKPLFNAAIRTTAAFTIVKGGIKENVLPHQAEALVNFRLFPTDTIAEVCDHVRKVIDDKAVEIEAIEGSAWEASPVTSPESSAFISLSRAIRQVYPEVVVAPYLVMGATDARHYSRLSDQTLRFTPLPMQPEDFQTVHGINEHVSVASLGRMVQFYIHLMREWCGG